jgi:hypothetical protein
MFGIEYGWCKNVYLLLFFDFIYIENKIYTTIKNQNTTPLPTP